MRRKSDEPEEQPTRETQRYTIPLTVEIEIRKGPFMASERVPARPVDLSIGGVACHVQPNSAFRLGKRFRIFVDGRPCFAEIRNIASEEGLTRIGMSFIQLELETQERIVDALDAAKFQASRLKNTGY